MEHGVFEAFASADPPWSFLREAGFIELHWEFVAQLGHVHFQLYQLYFWWVTSSSIAIKCMIFNDCQQRNFLMIGLVWFRISVIVLQMGPLQAEKFSLLRQPRSWDPQAGCRPVYAAPTLQSSAREWRCGQCCEPGRLRTLDRGWRRLWVRLFLLNTWRGKGMETNIHARV